MGLSRRGRFLTWGGFALVVLLPLGNLFLEAVFPPGGFDLATLRDLLLTSRQWDLLGSSILLAGGASVLAALIGVPYGFLCGKTDLPARAFFAVAYLIPLLIPPYMQAIVWSRLLANNSALNGFLMDAFGLGAPPLDVHSLPGALFVLAVAYFPFITLLTLSGLKSLDRSLEEAALLQRGGMVTALRVTLPLVRPQITAGILFVFVFAIIDFGVPDILRVQVYPVEIFIQFSALYNEQAAILLGLPLLGVTLAAIALLTRTMRNRSYVSLGAGFGEAVHLRLGPAGIWAAFFCASVLVIAVIVPAGALGAAAGPWETYWKAIRSSSGQIATSFVLALTAALLMTAFSLLVAMAIQASRGPWKTLAEYLSQLPFALPPIILGIGLIKLWNRPALDWLYGTPLIVVLGYVAHFVPFTIRAVYSNLQQLNPRLMDAGLLARSGGIVLTGRILVPLMRHGLLASFFIAFILAMGELGTTLMVIPPGTATIPVKIYNFMHYGAEATVAALCLILLVLQLCFAGVLFLLGRSLERRMG